MGKQGHYTVVWVYIIALVANTEENINSFVVRRDIATISAPITSQLLRDS
jgi:hypothetical protein